MSENAMEILLVEDNVRDAELTIRQFNKRHLANHLHWVKDGAAALDLVFTSDAECELPKVILLDLKLPKVDGLEVLRQLKGDPRTKSIPVVVLTSSREDCDLKHCYELGVNSYIVKPVDFNNFSEAVAQLGFYWLMLNQVADRPSSVA